jgi:hypothetical protein
MHLMKLGCTIQTCILIANVPKIFYLPAGWRHVDTQHSTGFSPVWMRSCLRSVPPSANAFQQKRHPYGCSLVWIRTWIRWPLRDPRVLPQWVHENRRADGSFLWLWRGFIRACPPGNSKLHSSHDAVLSLWETMCLWTEHTKHLWTVLCNI